MFCKINIYSSKLNIYFRHLGLKSCQSQTIGRSNRSKALTWQKKRNTNSLLRQTDGPLLDQDDDEAEDDNDSYDAETDCNDTLVPSITAYSTQLEVPTAHLLESDDPEPDEFGLNEFYSPINTLARTTLFRIAVLNNLQNSPLAPRLSSPVSFHSQTVGMLSSGKKNPHKRQRFN